ncbi:MAG: hypothetical protein NTW16_02005, partial [Bacteroidetes bacterium]|nr:hypothetical protein [Bacteroidota bacterium]
MCGISPIAVVHLTSDGVAPVDKTVTYGTVTNIPGETTKCWITRNLGASQQSTAFDDDTEASAGWYWQFNRNTGYEHDGENRTPSINWLININETSDWIAANDPCNIELGTTWRIPTFEEWYNVYNTGGWTNWNDSWNSGLKLHAAGYLWGLAYLGGSLSSRGVYGYYWSSMQYDATNGSHLYFDTGDMTMFYREKAYGFSIRCLKDLLPTMTTTAVTSITTSTATSGGNVTDDGGSTITTRGVCWSTSINPLVTGSHTNETGTTGVFTSNLADLTASTLYYVRAYATSSTGTAYGNEVSFTTAALNVCSTSTITISHLTSGGVAPVDKSVTYGTVSTTLFGGTKCAITQNLGATNEAGSKTDAAEASAGWYWQFNRKQGYKH